MKGGLSHALRTEYKTQTAGTIAVCRLQSVTSITYKGDQIFSYAHALPSSHLFPPLAQNAVPTNICFVSIPNLPKLERTL